MKRSIIRTLTTIGAATALALTALSGQAFAAPPTLTQAVTTAVEAHRSADALQSYGLSPAANLEILVEPKRTSKDGDWVFGGSVFLVPQGIEAAPVTSLFFAQRTTAGWQIALKGTAEFATAAHTAPDEILIDDGERQALAATAAPAIAPTGLALPWQNNQGNWRHWGVHGNSGTSRPYNSIDFYGGDGQVRASAGGYLYRYCGTSTPLIEVEHSNGWTTSYYHTWSQTTVPDGSLVNAYAYIGRIGERLPCGGSANGDHVHWSLWQGGNAVAVNGREIGGWTWYESSTAYRGYAQRGTTQLYNSNCCLTNYGPGNPGTATGVAHNPGGVVNVRSGPQSDATVVRTLAHGTVVELECYVHGSSMTGPWNNTSSIWDRLPDGSYVSDAWLDTGSNDPIVAPC